LNNVDVVLKVNKDVSWRMLCGILMVTIAAGLAACGSKDKKASQSLARVDGVDITVLQLNDELQRANVQADKQDAASEQLLESLIDRQLILEEAMRNKIDRTPQVVQAIERAKAQIIAQAYLQSVTAKVAKPTRAEIDDYFQKHPEFFSKRKQFILNQLTIPEKNFSDELKLFIDTAKTQQEVADWMDRHSVQYARGQVIRSTMDLPAEAVTKLLELPKGQLFIVSEGDNRVLNVIVAIKDSPVTASNVAPLIEKFLINEKMKEAARTEIAHLRSQAKIEYLNGSAPDTDQTQADDKAAGPK
jgi:peptidyl-prolyl cis-trans isomerase C